jgi:hypothetical protein
MVLAQVMKQQPQQSLQTLNDIINNQTSNHTLGWKSQQKIKVVDNNSIHSEFFLRLISD